MLQLGGRSCRTCAAPYQPTAPSTARPCLRSASDCVHSHSSAHASSRVGVGSLSWPRSARRRFGGRFAIPSPLAGPARHTDTPPDEQRDREGDDRPPPGRTVRASCGSAPSVAKEYAELDQHHRPDERPGGRVDDELAQRHARDAGREADERAHDGQQPAEEGGRRAVRWKKCSASSISCGRMSM